jgi:hypothetical protein
MKEKIYYCCLVLATLMFEMFDANIYEYIAYRLTYLKKEGGQCA